jgi:FMN reductase [NAD(P)H]
LEFREVVRRRRMVRHFRPDPVPSEVLERILATARRAPSAGYAQGQHLVVVTDPAVRLAIAELAGESEHVARGLEPWLSRAPIHLVLCCREEDYRQRYREPDKVRPDGQEVSWPVPYWYLDAGCTLMLILLAAVDEGLGAGFLGGHRLEGVNRLLGLPPEVQVLGLVTLGTAGKIRRTRSEVRGPRPVSEILHRERWNPPPPG